MGGALRGKEKKERIRDNNKLVRKREKPKVHLNIGVKGK